MCGILGIWHYDGRPVEPSAVQRATSTLHHRGPDDEGYLFVNTRSGRKASGAGRDTHAELSLQPVEAIDKGAFDLALGFRRLSILDLSAAGHQPMASADKSCWIIFNGEVYNYVELKAELAREGYEFRTGTDTEVILASYQHWGAGCVERFTGMWALAIWDERERRLFLSRDHFGIKPLYYFRDESRFIFASEIKAVLAFLSTERRANLDRLYEYLRSGITDYGDQTLFDTIRQLPAAHRLIIDADAPLTAEPERYWQIDLKRQSDLSFEEAADELRRLFLDSVRLHLRSDARVGAALSGGIDSSAIVASMRRLEPRLKLHTFSYTAEDPSVNEEQWVNVVGEAVKAEVHKVSPSPEELVTDLDALIQIQDEPFGSTSIYAQYRIFRLAHEAGIKVMLDGQGADEMLAGYRIYLTMRMASLLRRGQLLKANRFLKQASALPGNTSHGGFYLAASAGGLILQNRFQFARRFFKRTLGKKNGMSADWLDEDWFLQQGVVPRTTMKPRGPKLLQENLYESITGSLPSLLRYEDRNSMAHSIESRVPFLTSQLAEFILALPEEYIIGEDGTSKSVFRRAMRGIVPDAILDRRDKIGFATPESQWLGALKPWVEDVLASDAARQIPGLNLELMKQEWEAMLAGRQSFDFRVWRWLNIIRWVQKFEVAF